MVERGRYGFTANIGLFLSPCILLSTALSALLHSVTYVCPVLSIEDAEGRVANQPVGKIVVYD
jgi:hypothetical protein